MSNLAVYSKVICYVENSVLTQEGKVTIKRESGAQNVKTVHLGFSGKSPGSPMMQVSITTAIPSADFELNPGPFIASLTEREFTFFCGGRTLTTTGFIDSDNITHATDTASELSFECTCVYADWI